MSIIYYKFSPDSYLTFTFTSAWMTPSWWFHPARRPQLGSNAQPQTNRYGYV